MEWSRGPSIGRGASAATVSIATSTSGELFAVKSAELSSSGFLQREQHFLSELSSPYIVQYMGFEITCESNKPIYNLFMEYVPGGTISDEIKRQGGSLDESVIGIYARQILLGLDYLHLNGLVHCDIKGQNVLIGEDGVKIADLGCARWVAEDGGVAAAPFSGTPVFMAPEVARGEKQGFSADVWALGCTIIEMATGSHPWPEVNDPVSALYRIGFSGEVPELPTWFSEKAKDFLGKCLRRDYKERWTAKELLHHPFLDDLESNSPKVDEEFTRNSPTTVLDQGVWDSVDVSEAHRNLTHIGSSSNFPAERIRNLIGDSSNFPNWSWEEDWITVRSKEDIEETVMISEQDFNVEPNERQLIDMESYNFSAVNFEEFGSSIVINFEDLLPEAESSVHTISDIYCFSISIGFVMLCESVKDVIIVPRILTLERMLMKVLFVLNLSVVLNPFSF
ncbi:hypothetical protein ACSBR1_028894 [Camellia fascicularis]